MNPIALIEVTAATQGAVFGALNTPGRRAGSSTRPVESVRSAAHVRLEVRRQLSDVR